MFGAPGNRTPLLEIQIDLIHCALKYLKGLLSFRAINFYMRPNPLKCSLMLSSRTAKSYPPLKNEIISLYSEYFLKK